MIVARKKRKENISEYLLYMWQVEDILRALKLDTEAITSYVKTQYRLEEPLQSETLQWYLSLRDELIASGATAEGHLPQLSKLIEQLGLLHKALLEDPTQGIYSALFYKTLPHLVHLRTKQKSSKPVGEIETAYIAVYGYMTLRLKGEEVSSSTMEAIRQISLFLAMLADRFHAVEEGEISLSHFPTNA